MWKALWKKQFLELTSFTYQNRKTGRNRSRAGIVLYGVFFLLIYVSFCGLFYQLAGSFVPLLHTELNWLYYALLELMALAFGTFGSVFHTYEGLYHAKDNDMLLAMPLKPSMILLVRMCGVAAMGFFYASMILIPALLRGMMEGKVTVGLVVSDLVILLLVTGCITVLSCFLGWIVALLSAKFKNKSFLTVIFFLVFLCAYYYVFYRSYEIVQKILLNSELIGSVIHTWFYPLYLLGRASFGEITALLLCIALTAVCVGLTCFLLTKTFVRIATQKNNGTKAVYKEKKIMNRGMESALLNKEWQRFTKSPMYLLNCGLGTFIMPVLAILSIVNRNQIRVVLQVFEEVGYFWPVIFTAGICMMATLNDLTAPSISLEGKNIWILQSLPVPTKRVLRAKLKLHWLWTYPPVLFLTVCFAFVSQLSLPAMPGAVLFVAVFVFFSSVAGLVLNLHMPNLKWTNEIVTIKQSMPVMILLFGGWLLVILFGILGYFLTRRMDAAVYLLMLTVVLAVVTVMLYRWLMKEGADIFDNL